MSSNPPRIKDKKPSAIKALRRFELAVEDLAFLGSQHPDTHAGIRKEYKAARINLVKYLPNADCSTGKPYKEY